MARSKTKKRATKSVKRKKFLFIPYPLVIFLLLCAGVYLVAWTFNANADDLIVNAIVKDKPITDPAVITSPADGTHFKAVPITVTGTCPDHGAYVEIFRNNFMGGSAICDASKQFSLQTDLFAGQNKLEAHVFNLTDDEGPVSAPVTVYYDVPASPQPGLQTSNGGKKLSPLLLTTAFVYKGYYTGQQVRWPLELSGGLLSYALNVDWGDGTNSVISRSQAGQFYITHSYKTPDGKDPSYAIKVQASDAAGDYSYLEFFVIISNQTTQKATGTTNIYSKGPPSLGGLHQWVWAAWPAYSALVLMALSYKLGERQEFLLLKKSRQIRRP